jgi:hypothetical protein
MELHQDPDPPQRGGWYKDGEQTAVEIDPMRLATAAERLRGEQSLFGGAVAGAAAALGGAAVWAAVTAATGYQIGWMAVGVGFLVGFAVRLAGKGIDKSFGVLGAVLALVGCVAGNLLTGCWYLAQEVGADLVDVLADLTPSLASQIVRATFSPIDLLFYGFAVYEGYRLSFRRVTQEDLKDRFDAAPPRH